jgi:hypothetical protein
VLTRKADISTEFHNSAIFYGKPMTKGGHKGIISISYWFVTELMTITLQGQTVPVAA